MNEMNQANLSAAISAALASASFSPSLAHYAKAVALGLTAAVVLHYVEKTTKPESQTHKQVLFIAANAILATALTIYVLKL